MNPRGDHGLPFVVFPPLLPRVFLVLLITCVLLSCRRQPDATAATIRLKDDLGTVLSLPSVPSRIISLAPGTTEILFALGLDSSVVGVTEFCDYPPEAQNRPSVGGLTNPSFERIVELRPDLIVMTVAGNSRADYDKLRSLGLQVFVSNPASFEGVYKSIGDLGLLCGRTEKADSLIATLRASHDAVRQTAAGFPRRSTLLLLSLQPLIAAGPGTFLDELLTHANAHNTASAAPTAYPMLSREEVLNLQPDVLLATSDIAQSPDDIRTAYPEWSSLRAIQREKIAVVDASLISRPGPRIVLGLQALVWAIHQ